MPLCLKKAVVTSLLKKPQLGHDVISNFRPASKHSFISKVIEKVVSIKESFFLTNPFNLYIFNITVVRLHLCVFRMMSY